MVPESEIVTFVLGIGALVFFFFNRIELSHIPSAKILLLAFSLFLTGWTLTIVENFILPDLLNYLEHLSYSLGSFMILIWCWRLFGRRGTVK
jgi:hypothetical protein